MNPLGRIAFALFLLGKYFCVEFDLGEFIWCEFGLVRIGYWGECDGGECDSPLRGHNSSDCHWVEFDCD